MQSLRKRGHGHLWGFVVAPALVLLAVVAVSTFASIPIERFTRDPADLAVQHPLWGVVSNLGVLLWCTCTAVCAFGAQMLARREGRVTEDVQLLRAAALFTALLLTDDLFMLHDDLARRYLGFGEPAVVVLLAVAALAYFSRFGARILEGEWGLLLFGLACLAASLLIDQINDRGWLGTGSWRYFAEDAPKFLGIAAWCGFHWRLAMSLLQPGSQTATAPATEEPRRHERRAVPRPVV
jgi:hypothetical protein